MRYMMLIYTRETDDDPSPEDAARLKAAHWAVIDDATRRGVLLGAEPLARTSSATTVRVDHGKALITDGPFAETQEEYVAESSNWCAESILIPRPPVRSHRLRPAEATRLPIPECAARCRCLWASRPSSARCP